MQNREFTEQGILEIFNFLGKLYDAGVRSLTISLPALIELVKSVAYEFEIVASTICQITNVSKALSYKRMGIERIVCDESINRNFDTLSRIRNNFGEKVELIANAICYKNCIYRMFHYNQIAGDSVKVSSEASVNYYPHRCIMQRYERLGNLLRLSWIRPEDLRFYTAIGINYFKLQGRHTVVNGDPVRAAESYMRGRCEGDLMELLDMFDPTSSFRIFIENKKLDGFIKPFYENPGFCKNDCVQCGYCDNYARKALDNKKSEEIIKKAHIFYNQYDQFKNKIESLKNMKNHNGELDDFRDIEFDLD